MTRRTLALCLLALGWALLHVVGVTYGTQNQPLHMSYVGDEQAPVNGALHILKEGNPFALRNLKTVYYGPVFSILALPAVLADAGGRVLMGEVGSAEEYRNAILFDWGGINRWLRVTAVLSSVLTLYFVYRILLSPSLNVTRNARYALLGTLLIAGNFYFFEYSHFFKHWAFLLTCLFGQLYFSVRIRESGGERSRDWWLHGVCTVLGFGVSYFNILYSVASVPLFISLYRKGGTARRYFLRYLLGVLGGCLLVFVWHPYALLRYLGFANIGSMSGALGGVQNPFAFSTASVGYYLRLIVVNNLALLFAAAVLAWVFVRKRVSGCGHWLYLFGSIALFNLALFIPASHHEGRYMLPTILMLALGTGVALVRYFTDSALRSRRVTLILLTLLGWYFLFHTVHIARWMVVWSAGPPEKAMVEEALRLQVPGKPVLLIQSYLAGHPHTKDAYHAYATLTGKTEVNLYRAIFAATPKPSVPLLEVRYVQPPAFSRDPRVLAAFDHAILMFEPRPGELNQFDYMDEDVLRLWYYGELMPRYTVVK